MSPTALISTGDVNFGTNPVCRPFWFSNRWRRTTSGGQGLQPLRREPCLSRQDHIQIIADADPPTTSSPATCRSSTVAATDVDALTADSSLSCSPGPLGYQGITINIGNINGVGKPGGVLPANWLARCLAPPGAAGVRAEPGPRRHKHRRLPGSSPPRAGRSVPAARTPPTPPRPAPSTTRRRLRRC